MQGIKLIYERYQHNTAGLAKMSRGFGFGDAFHSDGSTACKPTLLGSFTAGALSNVGTGSRSDVCELFGLGPVRAAGLSSVGKQRQAKSNHSPLRSDAPWMHPGTSKN